MPTPRRWPDEATRKREYRKRKREEAQAATQAAAQAPAASPTQDDGTSVPMQAVLASNPSLTVLEGIRDNDKALDSDRIRAATEIQKLLALEAQRSTNQSDLVELRRTIEALPPGDRLPWLRGELEEHRAAAGANTNEGGE